MNPKKRKQLLKKIVDSILSGDFQLSADNTEHSNSARREYKSPRENSSFNDGNTMIWDMNIGYNEAL